MHALLVGDVFGHAATNAADGAVESCELCSSHLIDHFSSRAVFCTEDKALVGATSQTSAYCHTNLCQSL